MCNASPVCITIPQREPAALISPDNLAHPQRRCCTRIRRGRQLCAKVRVVGGCNRCTIPPPPLASGCSYHGDHLLTHCYRELEREKERERERAKFCRHAEAASAVGSLSLDERVCKEPRTISDAPTDRGGKDATVTNATSRFHEPTGGKSVREPAVPLSSLFLSYAYRQRASSGLFNRKPPAVPRW